MSEATLQALYGDLEAFRQALDGHDFGQAGDVLAAHDLRLRQYIDTVGLQAPMQALRELLQLQHRLQDDMVAARDEAAAALRGIRQSDQASRRYRELVP